MWQAEPTDDYVRGHKFFEKKHPRELEAVTANLLRLREALQKGWKMAQIKYGFLRSEGRGVWRISEQGGGGSLKATRLYIFPDEDAEILYLLKIGDKASQSRDIQACKLWSDDHTKNKGVDS
jgi:putative component of toxin-antitoxin plasmid stabilization module